MDGCLGGPGQGGMPGGHRLPADMLGQGLPPPKFGGVAEILRFRAGQMDHPSFGLFRQLRGTAMRCVSWSPAATPTFKALLTHLATLFRVKWTALMMAAMLSSVW